MAQNAAASGTATTTAPSTPSANKKSAAKAKTTPKATPAKSGTATKKRKVNVDDPEAVDTPTKKVKSDSIRKNFSGGEENDRIDAE